MRVLLLKKDSDFGGTPKFSIEEGEIRNVTTSSTGASYHRVRSIISFVLLGNLSRTGETMQNLVSTKALQIRVF